MTSVLAKEKTSPAAQATRRARARKSAGPALHPYTRFARFAARLLPEKTRLEMMAKAQEESSEGFLKAIRFSRLNVDPFEVEMAAYVGCALVTLGTLALGVFVGLFLVGLEGIDFIMYVVAPVAILALLSFMFLGKFPESHAKALRARSSGQMPEAISYLALSMQLNPSLTKAVAFAADHTQEPVAGSLRQVLWKVYTREHARIEDAFVDFAYEWGDWNEDFKKALYTIRAAEMEATASGREATLDKATVSMYKGARATVEDFALSLGGPTTVFFAAGIILPMMVGSMLPLLGLGGTSVSPTFVVFLFDVVFPAITGGYAYHILRKRPGTSPPPDIDASLTPAEKVSTGIATALAFAIPLGVGLMALQIPWLFESLGYLPFLWAGALPLAVYAIFSTRRAAKERDRIRKLEQEYPDALYQIGTRMGEGHPVEKAMKETSEGMRGSEVSRLFGTVIYRIQILKASLDDALFGPEGVLTRQPSRVVQNTMKVVVGATTKEARTAGRTIVNISIYLREMLTVEREIRNRLKEVTDTMLSTGTFFAPAVLGVTGALNLIITNTLGEIKFDEGTDVLGFSLGGASGGDALSPALFGLVVGIYLVLTVIIISYFVSGIRDGDDRIELKQTIGNGLPLALLVYTVTTVFVQIFLGD